MPHSHFIEMILIMIVAGALSTMNVWATSWEHIQFSLNDVYMIGLMTGWMVLFMAILHRSMPYFLFGLLVITVSIYAVRTQLFVSYRQYLKGMIPHHSMAVQMSKFQNTEFAKSIEIQRLKEISYMKSLL